MEVYKVIEIPGNELLQNSSCKKGVQLHDARARQLIEKCVGYLQES
jgi:hypothetical protein